MTKTDPDLARRLLEEALARSGLSARKFAEILVARDERSIRRWRSGEQAIPEAVVKFLRTFTEGSHGA